jgi:transcriptional regulator with XRE-family HTH domain
VKKRFFYENKGLRNLAALAVMLGGREELAKLLGISLSTLQGYFKGSREIPLRVRYHAALISNGKFTSEDFDHAG